MTEELHHPADRPVPTRRSLLALGLAGLGGAAVGATAGAAVARESGVAVAPVPAGTATIPFHGDHQSGIATAPQARAAFLAFDLAPRTDREALRRLLRLWTDDAARLTQGEGALADSEPELATIPAGLTITLGFGPRTLDLVHLPRPARHGVADLPSFPIDRLEPAWSGGDLLVQVCADDPLTVAHAARMLTKDVRTFGRPRWRQDGFRGHSGDGSAVVTPRNLMGQVDGTVNPSTPSEFDDVVWIADGPAAGGTTLVLRRIRMDLDRWDLADRRDRELVIGRRLSDGAPLTGSVESDTPDLDALDDNGLPVIPSFAHVRRAHPSTTGARILRRPYSYQSVDAAGATESGLLFTAYQADVDDQYLPIQRSLAELDLLNQWTSPIGSSVFLVPPGCSEGGYLGDTLV